MNEDTLSNNLRYAKEKVIFLEIAKSALESDNQNLRSMVKSLEDKNALLLIQIQKL